MQSIVGTLYTTFSLVVTKLLTPFMEGKQFERVLISGQDAKSIRDGIRTQIQVCLITLPEKH